MFNIKVDKYNRSFGYKPRFYNEEKEALQRKIRLQKLSEGDNLTEDERNQLRKDRAQAAMSGMKNAQDKHAAAKEAASARLRRLTLIFIFFAGLYWWANNNLASFINYLTGYEETQAPAEVETLQDDFEALPYRTIPANQIPQK